ncbi:hypothetical protein HL657_08625 [Methanoculleus sp. YWC-01]|jgi:hypothetical protein|uniref:Uncharacterized protein n=1 Tax=Methanoculleus nereidis TaxID=2735141 RepID=A0ABU3Z346_9EURY|nr:hypothetical protein [Methanoculleus sp. YWC-01]MCK9298005.1 hypothetical protein [Methanoculleus sp.]MDV4343228.1 hypothetical protein [Methanoculleus sp. YWC-01]PKL56574.1 MAG: hypothetical protein CVV35_04170 [Methanomicrobiales archaeon HGW-Methanomicrobiales-6]
MSSDRDRPLGNPVGKVIVILAVLGIIVTRGKEISSSVGALAAGTPEDYCYRNTGYAFIETTVPSIPTDAGGEYRERSSIEVEPEGLRRCGRGLIRGFWREHADAAGWNTIRGVRRERIRMGVTGT